MCKFRNFLQKMFTLIFVVASCITDHRNINKCVSSIYIIMDFDLNNKICYVVTCSGDA